MSQHMTQPVKNGPEDDYLLVKTCSLHITLCNNKNSHAGVQFLVLQYYKIKLTHAMNCMYIRCDKSASGREIFSAHSLNMASKNLIFNAIY